MMFLGFPNRKKKLYLLRDHFKVAPESVMPWGKIIVITIGFSRGSILQDYAYLVLKFWVTVCQSYITFI